MITADITGKKNPEAWFRDVLKTDRVSGTILSKVPENLNNLYNVLGEKINVTLSKKANIKDIQKDLNNGLFISAQVKINSANYHQLVIDKIENGQVFIRDPWPLGIGSSYSISVEDFNKNFTGLVLKLEKVNHD